jgi:hypothetical protein
MAIQYPQYRNTLTKADLGIPDYAESLNKGLNLYQNTIKSKYLPRNMENEAVSKEQTNQINAPYAQNADRVFNADIGGKEGANALNPYRMQLLQAQIQRQQKLSEDPFGGQVAPGEVGQVMWLKKLEDSLPGGKENPYYQQAQQALELKRQEAQGLNDYRKALTQTAPKRASTQIGKIDAELNEVNNGFMPGSNGSVKLEPQEQELLKGQYELARQKFTSDVDTRKKLLYATNLDKTLDAINPDDLVQYSGIAGAVQKKLDQGKSIGEHDVIQFEKYQKALTASKLLAKQVRQFYGDSITPGIQEQLGELTNPESWKINPRLAKSKFEQFKKILQSETQTYRDATSNTNVYKQAPKSSLRDKVQGTMGMPVKELTYNPATGRLE